MTAEEFVDKLEGVRKQRGGYIARCPAHEDRNPSLSVRETEDEDGSKLLVHCHAGCTATAVVDAMGLRMSDLMSDLHEDTEPKEVAVYRYTDEHNALLYEVVRYEPKTFRPRLPDGSFGLPEQRVLYNLPAVLTAQHVVLTEGEKDADAATALGAVGTTSVGGAGKWRPEYSSALAGRHVLVVVDKDDPGRKHAEAVRQALEGVSGSVRLVQAKRGKDLSDHIAAGFGLKDLVPVRERRVEGVVTAVEMAEHAIKDVDRPEKSGAFYTNPWGFDEPQYVPGRLYVRGAVTAGGKTTTALQEFRHLSEQGVKVVYVTMEQTERDLRNRLLCHHGFKLKELERPWTMADDTKAAVRARAAEFKNWNSAIVFSTAADYHYCNDLIEEMDCEFLIFDHLHQVGDVAGGEEKQIAMQIRGFRNLALDWEIPVLVLSQFKRPLMPGQVPALSDFKGSSAIEQNAAMAMALHSFSPTNYQLLVLKNRDGRRGEFNLAFDGARFTFTRPEQAAEPAAGGITWQ